MDQSRWESLIKFAADEWRIVQPGLDKKGPLASKPSDNIYKKTQVSPAIYRIIAGDTSVWTQKTGLIARIALYDWKDEDGLCL